MLFAILFAILFANPQTNSPKKAICKHCLQSAAFFANTIDGTL